MTTTATSASELTPASRKNVDLNTDAASVKTPTTKTRLWTPRMRLKVTRSDTRTYSSINAFVVFSANSAEQ